MDKIKIRELFIRQIKNENYNKMTRLKGGQSIFIQRPTRINMLKIIDYLLNSNSTFHYPKEIQKGIGSMDKKTLRSTLLLLCLMRKSFVKCSAYRSFNKGRKKPNCMIRIRLVSVA